MGVARWFRMIDIVRRVRALSFVVPRLDVAGLLLPPAAEEQALDRDLLALMLCAVSDS